MGRIISQEQGSALIHRYGSDAVLGDVVYSEGCMCKWCGKDVRLGDMRTDASGRIFHSECMTEYTHHYE